MQEVMMAKGADTVIRTCGGVQVGETVLVIADYTTVDMARPLAAAARAAGARPLISIMEPREADGNEPPRALAAAMREADLFVAPVSRSITHTRAVKEAVQNGSRGLMLTQFVPDMLAAGGIEADFSSLAPEARETAAAMERGERLRVTNPAGTDLVMDIAGRRGNALVCMVKPGEFSPVPNVEANVSPIEGSASGRLVVDASVPYAGIGVLRDPIYCEVREGYIISIDGGEEAVRLSTALAGMDDPMVYNVAEVGIGLNPHCRLRGLMLEDEGVYGTVHIGIGTNITLGGKVQAACHYDLIISEPTVSIDESPILRAGKVIEL